MPWDNHYTIIIKAKISRAFWEEKLRGLWPETHKQAMEN